ncbi:ATP-binding protein [Rhizohabitans arisaemae]|uniref:ATP-binding protein n=1 Tax=Rhizohabitans arisaemae TaxID=2720610 RepID=UPI0024B14FAF|nr:AAA family ATPase [Rhizohabitans arisaemae]
MLDDMMGRMVSPVFVGRETELTALADAGHQAFEQKTAATVLIGGEAGAGKTRLITRFAEQAGASGARVLIGGCVELSTEGLAYAPFTAALRQLVRETGAAEVAALLPEGADRDLARLLPEFGKPAQDSDPDAVRSRLFEHLLMLLERLAEQRPLLLVLEDAHWADRSSRDLIAFLARNLGSTRTLIAVTFRSDELHRTHPLRPVLAELARLGSVRRLDLPRLTQSEVGAQIAGILGHPPESRLTETIYGRSEGIPLFVEALVEDGGDHTLPASLHDLIIDSMEKFPDETQRVLRVVSTASGRLSHALLAAVTGLADGDLEEALRPAVTANVLVVDADGYAFRHALMREALHGDLLPGEHVRIHSRFAEEIEKDRSLVQVGRAAIDIAHHWHAAHDCPRALTAAWQAAGKAAKALAHTEQMKLLQRVLELWERVPDAAERTGVGHTRVLEMASVAAHTSGEVDRGLAFIKGALGELDETVEPERVALLLVRRANLKSHRGKKAEELADLRRAEQLVPHPGETRAVVLSHLTAFLIIRGDIEEGQALNEEALAIARELGDVELENDLLSNRALVLTVQGDHEASLAVTLQSQVTAERVGSGRMILRAIGNSADSLIQLGRAKEAIKIAEEGMSLAKKYGRHRVHGTFIAANHAEALEALGLWDEAVAVIEAALDSAPVRQHRGYLLEIRGDIAVSRGDIETAERIVADGLISPDTHSPSNRHQARLLIALHVIRREYTEALDVAERILTHGGGLRAIRLGWRLLIQIKAACDLAGPQTDQARAVRRQADEVAALTPAKGPVDQAYNLVYRERFDQAAAAWAKINRPFDQAQALVQAAAQAASAGARDGLDVRLRTAHEIASRLGARPLAQEAAELARRVGVSLNGAAQPVERYPLTPRELEVLRLVAEGRSNKEIAGELFISAKTASVHVSNILAKLNVSTRGEAAAAAHRIGLPSLP